MCTRELIHRFNGYVKGISDGKGHDLIREPGRYSLGYLTLPHTL